MEYSIEAPLKPLIKISSKDKVNGIISGVGTTILNCLSIQSLLYEV